MSAAQRFNCWQDTNKERETGSASDLFRLVPSRQACLVLIPSSLSLTPSLWGPACSPYPKNVPVSCLRPRQHLFPVPARCQGRLPAKAPGSSSTGSAACRLPSLRSKGAAVERICIEAASLVAWIRNVHRKKINVQYHQRPVREVVWVVGDSWRHTAKARRNHRSLSSHQRE